jgi:uncharacterized protein
MKRNLVILFYLLPLLSAIAQPTSSVLWEISGNGLTNPSYLLGTLKFIGEKEFAVPAVISEKLTTSTLFAIEDQVDHHAQHEMNKVLHFENKKSLASELSPAEYQKVISFFQKEFGISKKAFEAKYNKIKPLPLSILMTRLTLKEKVKYFDIELLLLAKKAKIATFSLEPIEREAQAINAYPIYNQVKALMHSIDNFETQKAEFKKLMMSYPQESLEEIFEFTLHPVENNPIFIDEFYFKRNVEWLPKIEKMAKEEKAFIAVGVAHLEGEKGLLQLLKAKGYSLKPIPVNK